MAAARVSASQLLWLAALAAVAVAGPAPQSRKGYPAHPAHPAHASHPGYPGVADRQRPVQQFSTTPLPDSVPKSSWEPCKCPQGQCVCVMYYLCNVATNTVYIYGEGVLGERFSKLDKCPDLEFCCQIPQESQNASAGADMSGVAVLPPLPTPTPGTGLPNPTPEPVPVLPAGSGEVSAPNPPREGEASTLWECGVRRTDFALLDNWARLDDRESDEVAFAEFPWTLIVINNSNDTWLGGASLISPRIALTAAHNVQGIDPSQMRVRAGEWNVAKTDEPLPHQDRRVAQMVVHPMFVRRALFYDAALLVLEAPFDAAPHVAPVCLPPYSASFDGRRCVATGWGVDTIGKEQGLRKLMRRVELPVVPRSECEKRLRTTRVGIFFNLHESFMCAGLDGLDTCKGDGGGPLVCQSQDDPRRYEQVGIVSWGIECNNPEVPAVYTDVSKLRPWLDQQLLSLDP